MKDGWTMKQIKEANKRAGYYFFSPETMRFFDSRVDPEVYEGDGGVFFVTSEQFHGSQPEFDKPRGWTVREFRTGGKYQFSMETHGPHAEFDQEEAHNYARLMAMGQLDADFMKFLKRGEAV